MANANDLIQVDLNTHEELIRHIDELVNHSMELAQKLASANEIIGAISTAGSFKDKILANDNALNKFTKKAQTLHTLAEIMSGHATDTFQKLVDLDKLLALSISDAFLQDPVEGPKFEEALKNEPETFENLKEVVKTQQT